MQSTLNVEAGDLLLQRAYRWEKEIGSVVYMIHRRDQLRASKIMAEAPAPRSVPT